MLEALFFPTPAKALVASLPVRAWNAGSALQIFGPTLVEISCSGMYRRRSLDPVSSLLISADIRRDHPTVTLSDLQANHEEADTRLLFHAKHASQPDSRIIIPVP